MPEVGVGTSQVMSPLSVIVSLSRLRVKLLHSYICNWLNILYNISVERMLLLGRGGVHISSFRPTGECTTTRKAVMHGQRNDRPMDIIISLSRLL